MRTTSNTKLVSRLVETWKSVWTGAGIPVSEFNTAASIALAVIDPMAEVQKKGTPAKRRPGRPKSKKTREVSAVTSAKGLTLEQAAKKLGLKLPALRYNVKKGYLKAEKVGRSYYVDPVDIQSFQAAQTEHQAAA